MQTFIRLPALGVVSILPKGFKQVRLAVSFFEKSVWQCVRSRLVICKFISVPSRELISEHYTLGTELPRHFLTASGLLKKTHKK